MNPRHRLPSATLLSAALLAAVASTAMAHGDRNQSKPRKPGPLTIEEQGSFYVGGEVKNRGTNADITINQMYVQYEIPAGKAGVPIVLTHGCCLSSKTWETTPDGRMGWDEYFVRKGYPVYMTDQSGRARSGFDATNFNLVRSGALPPNQQPSITQASHQLAWSIFRFGPTFGTPHPDGQFPTDAFDELWKQTIPDINAGLPQPNPNWPNLAKLGRKLGGAVLVGHSQSGSYPFHAAVIDPKSAKGLINIETGNCTENYGVGQSGQPSAAAMKILAKIPILVIFGDYIEGGSWEPQYLGCKTFVDQVNAAGGNATMMHLPKLGIRGNSHMLMQDKNNLQIADLILKWIDRNVDRKGGGHGRDDDRDDDRGHGGGHDRDHDDDHDRRGGRH